MRPTLLVFAVLALAGCVHHNYYVNGASNEYAFARDQDDCAHQASSSGVRAGWGGEGGAVRAGTLVDTTMFRSCMRTRGYSVASLDASEAPPNGYFLSDFDH